MLIYDQYSDILTLTVRKLNNITMTRRQQNQKNNIKASYLSVMLVDALFSLFTKPCEENDIL